MIRPQIAPVCVVVPAGDREAYHAAVDEILDSGQLTQGKYTAQLEKEFGKLHRTRHAVAVGSCSVGLQAVLQAIGLAGRKRRRVIVPSNTFFATAAAVVHAGGVPVIVDVDRETMCLSPKALVAAIDTETAAVMVVHVGGAIQRDIWDVVSVCERVGVPLIEDAAHAQGAEMDGVHAGSFGLAGVFSFYPTKVTTSGEGGMVVTDCDQLARRVAILRDHGKDDTAVNWHVAMGFNWRMSEFQAALGLLQTRRLRSFVRHREMVAGRYADVLHGTAVTVQWPAHCRSSWYKVVCRFDPTSVSRQALKDRMAGLGVHLPGEVYAHPLHEQPVFTRFAAGDYPGAEYVSHSHLCLPVFSDQTDDEMEYVGEVLREVIGKAET